MESKIKVFNCILSTLLIDAVSSGCYNYYYSRYSFYDSYCNYDNNIPIGTIIGAVIGGIVGLIVLITIIVAVVCICVCKKKKTQGMVIQPANISATVTTSASYNSNLTYPQHHGWGTQQQGWGVYPVNTPYHGYGQQPQPSPVSEPMPPPTYAENVLPGQPPRNTD